MTNSVKFDDKDYTRKSIEVSSPSEATELSPWQALHKIIDEGLGVVLIESHAIHHDGVTSHTERHDFDAVGRGYEITVVFLSDINQQDVSLDVWACDPNATEPLWSVIVERIDGKMVSGRIHAFEHHSRGIAARIRLMIYDREHPPEVANEKYNLSKIVVRYDLNRKTRKIAKASR